MCCRRLIRTLGITVRWHTGWLSHPQQRARTASSSRPTQASSSRPSCFETCAGPTSSFKLSPQTTMGKVSAAVPKWWWVHSMVLTMPYVYFWNDQYMYCTCSGLCTRWWTCSVLGLYVTCMPVAYWFDCVLLHRGVSAENGSLKCGIGLQCHLSTIYWYREPY